MIITPPWKLRRMRYILNHFGSYEAIRQSGEYDYIEGVWKFTIPDHVRAQIEADPKCHPPR